MKRHKSINLFGRKTDKWFQLIKYKIQQAVNRKTNLGFGKRNSTSCSNYPTASSSLPSEDEIIRSVVNRPAMHKKQKDHESGL